MVSSPLFYRYYDTLFAAKDYGGEVAAVLRHWASCSPQPLRHILEIGCGTGNHTLELAKSAGVHITAVDVDPVMLELARTKAERAGETDIAFSSSIPDLQDADLCVALFNVINYLIDDASLQLFFTEVAAALRPQGMFIFDCWNGTAALLDPPGSKSYGQQCADGKVLCNLTSRTDFARRVTTLDYRLELVDKAGRQIESGCHRFEHRLWTPGEVRGALRGAGLEVATVCIPFEFERLATESDWKIMFVCRKW